MRILIDNGHGGIDKGAVGYVVEKDINNNFSQMLKDAITGISSGSVEVIILPDGANAMDDLNITVNSANNYSDDDLLISVHSNAGGGHGMETWVQAGYNSGRTRQLAEAVHYGYLNGIRETYAGYPDRGIKEGNLMVTRETKMSAVLLELGFVDNPDDAHILNDDNAMWIAADRTARSVLSSFGLWTETQLQPEPQPVVPEPTPTPEPVPVPNPTTPNEINRIVEVGLVLGQENVNKLNAGYQLVIKLSK